MPSPFVSLVVLNWNGASIVRECIESLQKLEYPATEIIVVDNGSTDDSIAVIESVGGISIVKNRTNLGYAGGLNAGIRAAKGTYVATINNDITADPAWLNEIIPLLESDGAIGIISGRQMNYLNRDIIDALYSYLHPSLIFFQEAFRKRYDAAMHGTSPVRVLGVSGASTIYRKKMLEELNGLDETLFAYHEESDLCMRAFLAGWKCIFVPSAVTYHRRSVSFNRIKGAMFYYQTRNRLWFIYKYSPLSLILTNAGWIILTELRILRVVIFRERVLFSYIKGLLDGMGGMFGFKAVRRSNIALLRKKMPEYSLLIKKKFIPFYKG
jgi:hypothetical protein